jgi:hypothetical protein
MPSTGIFEIIEVFRKCRFEVVGALVFHRPWLEKAVLS